MTDYLYKSILNQLNQIPSGYRVGNELLSFVNDNKCHIFYNFYNSFSLMKNNKPKSKPATGKTQVKMLPGFHCQQQRFWRRRR